MTLRGQVGCLPRQIALLGEARRSARGGAIVVDCLLAVVGHLQEACADGAEAVAAGETLVELVEERKPTAF